MPIYNYDCQHCGFKFRDLAKKPDPVDCPNCSAAGVEPSLPTGGTTEVMEAADKTRGINVRKNNNKMLRDRMNKHHDEEVVFDKIDQHGMNDAEKFGWLKRARKK